VNPTNHLPIILLRTGSARPLPPDTNAVYDLHNGEERVDAVTSLTLEDKILQKVCIENRTDNYYNIVTASIATVRIRNWK